MKLFKQCVTDNNIRCDVEHYPAKSFDELDTSLVKKIHAVCYMDGKVVLVNHPEWNIWGIPGGTREDGESVFDTLHREIQEETNCCVEKVAPLSYDKVIHPDDNTYSYRLYFFCKVSKIDEFHSDTAGNIDKIIWIDPVDYASYIENKPFKQAIFEDLLCDLDFYKQI